MTDPSEGEQLFERLKQLKFPSLAPVRIKDDLRKKTLFHGSRSPSETELEAVMKAFPYEEVPQSTEELLKERDDLSIAVMETFNSLSEEEQWIYHMLVDIGLSMRFVARVLDIPKTTFARRRDELADKIRILLLEHEVVRKKLGF